MAKHQKHLVFLVNLIQDVNIYAPIIGFAPQAGNFKNIIMYTKQFVKRDAGKIWFEEVRKLAAQSKSEMIEISNVRDVVLNLQDKKGILLTASETDLGAHQICNEIVRGCPSSFVTLSLQHGFENIGLLHNDAHDAAFGHEVGFGSDIVVAWFENPVSYSIKPSQRSKIFVAGPPSLLPQSPHAKSLKPRETNNPMRAMICENLHSVRMRGQDTQSNFLDTLTDFVVLAEQDNIDVELRPHPGGQYLRRKNISLPGNLKTNEGPLYRQAIDRFDFAVSAPSSILLDMILADVPVAVWQSRSQALSLGNYAGLPTVCEGAEWLAFARRARSDRESLLKAQRNFTESLNIPRNVHDRYRNLLNIDADFIR